ncbi:MAG: metalloregulator ArsR/SmtB family transcription factor [Candidatus Dormibacteraeota bacterium]|nr:metalloregulator ArsR/SmtB family transcription factor [Candidatus Dormibacteraeota bacterium]
MDKGLAVLRARGTCCALPVAVDPVWASRQAELLKAIADPTRLTMVAALRKAAEPVCICDFTGALSLSQPTISHHMGKLREAGLVESEKRGVWVYYRLKPDLPAEATSLLDALLP